jgi:trafficking kinesin-binding protein 2
VINEFYRVIVKKTKAKQPNTQENRKSQEVKTGLQKPLGNLLGRLRRSQSLSVLMGRFGVPVCTSSPKMGILKED